MFIEDVMSYTRRQEDGRRNRKLLAESVYGKGVFLNEETGMFYRYDVQNKWFKRQARKTVRRRLKRSDESSIGGHYKKQYDYWWKVL